MHSLQPQLETNFLFTLVSPFVLEIWSCLAADVTGTDGAAVALVYLVVGDLSVYSTSQSISQLTRPESEIIPINSVLSVFYHTFYYVAPSLTHSLIFACAVNQLGVYPLPTLRSSPFIPLHVDVVR